MIRVGHSREPGLPGRAGLVALSELVTLVALLAGLFCIGSQFFSAITEEGGSAATVKGCSSRSVFRICLDRNGDHVWVFRPSEGVVRLDTASGEATAALPLAGAEIAAVAHSRSTAATLVCMLNGELILFSESGEPSTHRVDIGKGMVLDAAISDDGSVAACTTTSRQVFGLRRQGQTMTPFVLDKSSGSNMMRIGLNRDGTTMFLGCIDGTVEFLDPWTGHVKSRLQTPKDSFGHEHVAFAWSDDERLFVMATSQGRIYTFDVTTGELLCTMTSEQSQPTVRPTAIAVTSSGLGAFTSNTSTSILLIDMPSGQVRGQLDGHEGIVRSLDFGPENATLYSGSYDGTVRQWNVATKKELRTLD